MEMSTGCKVVVGKAPLDRSSASAFGSFEPLESFGAFGTVVDVVVVVVLVVVVVVVIVVVVVVVVMMRSIFSSSINLFRKFTAILFSHEGQCRSRV